MRLEATLRVVRRNSHLPHDLTPTCIPKDQKGMDIPSSTIHNSQMRTQLKYPETDGRTDRTRSVRVLERHSAANRNAALTRASTWVSPAYITARERSHVRVIPLTTRCRTRTAPDRAQVGGLQEGPVFPWGDDTVLEHGIEVAFSHRCPGPDATDLYFSMIHFMFS